MSPEYSQELDIMKLSKEEQADYESYIEDRRVGESSIKTSWIEGKIEGKIERNIEIARQMLLDGESVERIMKYTGLEHDEIGSLKGQA